MDLRALTHAVWVRHERVCRSVELWGDVFPEAGKNMVYMNKKAAAKKQHQFLKLIYDEFTALGKKNKRDGFLYYIFV